MNATAIAETLRFRRVVLVNDADKQIAAMRRQLLCVNSHDWRGHPPGSWIVAGCSATNTLDGHVVFVTTIERSEHGWQFAVGPQDQAYSELDFGAIDFGELSPDGAD